MASQTLTPSEIEKIIEEKNNQLYEKFQGLLEEFRENICRATAEVVVDNSSTITQLLEMVKKLSTQGPAKKVTRRTSAKPKDEEVPDTPKSESKPEFPSSPVKFFKEKCVSDEKFLQQVYKDIDEARGEGDVKDESEKAVAGCKKESDKPGKIATFLWKIIGGFDGVKNPINLKQKYRDIHDEAKREFNKSNTADEVVNVEEHTPQEVAPKKTTVKKSKKEEVSDEDNTPDSEAPAKKSTGTAAAAKKKTTVAKPVVKKTETPAKKKTTVKKSKEEEE